MSVYFSSIKINLNQYAVPSRAGWWEGRKLRHIHSFRYKPANEEVTAFQSEILAEEYNEVLKELASGKMNTRIEFMSYENRIFVETEIVSDSKDLKSVSFNSTKTCDEYYQECLSFFYPGNRIYRDVLENSGETDNRDTTRLRGWYGEQNANLYKPYLIAKLLDYMFIAHWCNKQEGKEYSQETLDFCEPIFDAFKTAELPIRLKYVGDLNWKFYIGKRQFDDLNFSTKETVSFALDLIYRLLMVGKNLKSSAICLIENSHALNSEVLRTIFPNVQFIVD